MRFVVIAVTIWSFALGASANDRLPARLRAGYGVAIAEVRQYMGYVVGRVFADRLRAMRVKVRDRRARIAEVDTAADEIVHLLLPEARRIVRDAVYGTDSTHLRIVRPELREKALRAALEAVRARAAGPTSLHEVLSRAGASAEEALEDRLEQALSEDMEDYASQWVETALRVPLRGRPRSRPRPLPEKWEKPYAQGSRGEVHGFAYWWLRKRQRTPITYLGQTKTADEIDRARHEAPVWGLASGISQEAWAQNRLRMDFKWGRHNWEIDRRRIRRRMDQDLAQATWAMARMVKALTAPETVDKLERHLERRLREALGKGPLREEAADYPRTRAELERKLDDLRGELDPLMNEALGPIPFPKDMAGPLTELAKAHGRRFMHEEMSGRVKRAIARAASPHVARRRVKERLPELVAPALARFDPGREMALAEARAAAKAFVRRETKGAVLEELGEALRQTGEAERDAARPGAGPTPTERLYDALDAADAVDAEVDRQLDQRARAATTR